ncbi:uncharacterized protein [Pocillopora verrucosa]|uniref:uncharacterized protein n=1 Tax=Pocillopora verrucosa TaxID=203993 RepID=UPI003341751A
MFSQLAKRSTRMPVIGIFQELRAFVVVSDALRKESFLLQMKYAMSASVEIILFRAYLIILVRESEPKLKETTVNYFKLRNHRSIEEYTRDNSEAVNQDARIAWASLMSSLEVARFKKFSQLIYKRRIKGKCSGECRGRRGPRGQRGRTGSKGQPGPKGPRGPPGENGRDGRNGQPGPIGIPGPPGISGPIGNKGIMGQKGEQGLRGPSGIPGLPGLPGSCVRSAPSNTTTPTVFCGLGKQGLKGNKGDNGNRGLPGPPGSRGNRGPRGNLGNGGPPGKKGDIGPPGNFPDLECFPRYTSWVNRSEWFDKYPKVHCDRREFLQGFSLEKSDARGQRRYKYTCCSLGLTNGP